MNTKRTTKKSPEKSGQRALIDLRAGIDTTDQRCPDGLPRWQLSEVGYHHYEAREMMFAVGCGVKGFNLPEFDLWLSELRTCPAKEELLERRAKVLAAFQSEPNNEDIAIRHLEFMQTRMHLIQREDFLLPLARTGNSVRVPFDTANVDRQAAANLRREEWRRRADELRQLPQHSAKSKSDIARLIDLANWNQIRKHI